MGLIECVVYSVLRRLGRVSMDRLAKVIFLVDRLGGFDAFNWDRIDLVITSPEFLNAVEELTKLGILRVINDLVMLANSNYDPGCGWLRDRVESVTEFVLNKYGNLSDGELDDVVEAVLEGVY